MKLLKMKEKKKKEFWQWSYEMKCPKEEWPKGKSKSC